MKAPLILTKSNNGTEKLGGVHYCMDHTGKMSGIISLSTSVLCNPICQQRCREGNSICAHCFAATNMSFRPSMQKPYERNFKILNGGILDDSVIPIISSRYGRGESFGDYASANAVINFWKLAKKNPDTQFAMWSKNLRFFAEAIEAGYKKPKNVQIVYSSPFVNKTAVVPEKYAGFVDKVFTVYDREEAKKVDINCGARSCLACGRCYRKNPQGVKIQEIREILK